MSAGQFLFKKKKNYLGIWIGLHWVWGELTSLQYSRNMVSSCIHFLKSFRRVLMFSSQRSSPFFAVSLFLGTLCLLLIFFNLFLRFYLFIHETHTERGWDTGRGRSRLHAGSLMWESIPGLQDHTLGGRQALNHRATEVSFLLLIL